MVRDQTEGIAMPYLVRTKNSRFCQFIPWQRHHPYASVSIDNAKLHIIAVILNREIPKMG